MQYKDLTLNTDGGEVVAVRDYPDNGPDVVLLHGAGLNLALWSAVATRLSEHYHLVAFDFRGHGQSTAHSEFSSAADLAALDLVISSLGLDNPAIVGHSYGGRVALDYARTHPNCPVVVNVDGRGGQGRPDHYLTKTPAEVEAYWEPFEQEMLASLPAVNSGTRNWVEERIVERQDDARADAFPVQYSTEMVERQFLPVGQEWVRTPSMEFLRGLLLQVWHADMLGLYQLAQCPVVAILATTDDGPLDGLPSFRVDHLEALARAFPTVGDLLPTRRVFAVPASHMVPVEDPDGLADLLRSIVPGTPAQVGAASS